MKILAIEKEAMEKLSELPLVKNNLIHFEIYPLHPYNGFARLFCSSYIAGLITGCNMYKKILLQTELHEKKYVQDSNYTIRFITISLHYLTSCIFSIKLIY